MSRLNDLTNQRFGSLIVLYRAEDHISPSGKKTVYWHCKCDCGKEKDIAAYSLTGGLTKSCGCLQKQKVSNLFQKDLTNQKFGKLLAIEPTNERKFGYVIWKCQCDCGNIHYVTTNALLQNQIQSCGKCNFHNSKGEEKIFNILKENNISFETEKTFDTCFFLKNNCKCRFDFYVENKYLIEYDGKQHFIKDSGFGSDLELIQKRDNLKTQWCKENNIPLIRIPYTYYDNLSLKDLLLETSNFIV